jgi:hypothetical protein
VSIDVHYQAIDVALFQGPVFDYVLGKGPPAALRAELIRVQKVRRAAGPWQGLVMHAYWKRLGKLPDWYNNEVVGSQRPFLIVEDLPARVGELIERYHYAPTPEATRALVDSQLAILDPQRWNEPGRWDLRSLPPPAWPSVEESVEQALALLEPYLPPRAAGEPEQQLDLEFARQALKFNERLQPFVELRAWFTEAIVQGRQELSRYFETPHALFEPLFGAHPELKEELSLPYRNERVGLYVRPENVPGARRAVEAALPTPVWQGGSKEEDYRENALRRLTELLCYAQRRGLGFAERIF